MSLKVPDVSERLHLTIICAATIAASCTMRLFKNNHTPADADVLADYTEADYAGYSAQALSSPVVAGSPTSGRATAAYNDVTFPAPSSGTQTVYGYFIKDSTTGLYWSELFSVPVVMAAGGSGFTLTPRLTLKSEA